LNSHDASMNAIHNHKTTSFLPCGKADHTPFTVLLGICGTASPLACICGHPRLCLNCGVKANKG